MNGTSFHSPLEVAQLIPIYTYVNVLSGFLFVENQLKEDDLYKYIPIVNALYNYFEKYSNHLGKKLEVVQKILRETDFYGSKSYEKLDETFVNTMLEYLVKSLVFNKNIYGFLAEVILSIENTTAVLILEKSISKLKEMNFENEYGNNSKLEPLAIRRIYSDIIEPMFPMHDSELNFFSVDYIYALAGLTFFRSNGLNAIFYHKESESRFWRHEMHTKISFEECMEMGHLIEQMTLANRIDKMAITVFSLPAILYYIYTNGNLNIESVVNDPTHWSHAFEHLFSYLETKLNETKKEIQPTLESEFYASVVAYKNRTTMAREIIKKYCLQKEDFEERVESYKNNNDDYYCYNFTQIIKLPDLRQKFMDQIEEIKRKCFRFELYKLKQAFGDNFTRMMDQQPVEIYLGYYQHFIASHTPMKPLQRIRYPNYMFKVYFPNNGTIIYYGLLNEGSKSTLYNSSNPLFVIKMKITKIHDSRFPYLYKTEDEKFEKFLSTLAREQAERVGAYLEKTGYDQTNIEWWTDFGLSLIPFYTCINSIFDRYQKVDYVSCIMDSLVLVPFLSVVKLATKAAKVFVPIQAVVQSLIMKQSLQAVLRCFASYTEKGFMEFSPIFREFGVNILDPGFELSYRIGKGGLTSITNLANYLGEKSIFTTFFIQMVLKNSLKVIDQVMREIGLKLGGNKIFVNTLDGDSGYGFKYTKVDDHTTELRTISGREKPCLSKQKACKMDDKWQVVEIDNLKNDADIKTFEVTFEEPGNVVFCEGGNFLCVDKKELVKENEIIHLNELGMSEPELFFDLQTREHFQSSKLKDVKTATKQIKKLYIIKNGLRDMGLFAGNIYGSYKSSNAFLNLRFEDFLAIRFYGLDGFNHIRGDTDVARRMKNAFYRLAIRQSRDSLDEYATELFRGEVRETEEIEKIFYEGRENYELSAFCSSSTEPSVSRRFSLSSSPTTTRVMYQMRFARPYLRANVENIMALREEETVLLPGTKFKVDKIIWKIENEKKVALTVKLSHDHESMTLIDWQKKVMYEIKKLKESGTVFYAKDL